VLPSGTKGWPSPDRQFPIRHRAARIKSWSKDQSLSVLEEEKQMDEEDGLQPGPSSVTFRSWRGNRRSIWRVNRKEHTVGFKVFLLLFISAAWAVSIEFPSLGLSHPNPVHLRLEELKGHSISSSALVDAYSKMSGAKSGELSESMARSGLGLGEIDPFPHRLPSDAKFPSFVLSHPDTNPVQDSTSHSTSSSNLSEFYLKKPHE
jgi:hypothetical protein